MPSSPRLRFALVLALLAAAGPARAAADLESVTYSLEITRVENAVQTITARIEVAGQRITRASITPPGVNPTTVDLAAEGDVFALEDDFTSEADLTKAFPDGTYTLTLNGTTQVQLELKREPLPSPAITAPLPAEVIVPGPLTVEFTPCSSCNGPLDATTGALSGGTTFSEEIGATKLTAAVMAAGTDPLAVENALTFPDSRSFDVQIGDERLEVTRLDDTHLTVLERGAGNTSPAGHAAGDRVAELGGSADHWTPAVELAPDSDFTVAITHSAVRTDSLSAGNDAFDLIGIFSDQDSVSFFTGGAVPSGSFCLVVNDDGTLDPAGECVVGGDENAALLDPSGTFSLSFPGDDGQPTVDMQYTSTVEPSGAITGTALADLDGNGSLETSAPVVGKLTGFMGKVDRNLGFTFVTPTVKLSVKIDESGLVTEGLLEGKQSAKGKVQGEKVKASAPSTLPLGDAPLGWRLDVDLAGKQIEDATVTLTDGREFALTGRFLFDFLTGVAKLDLQSEDGVRVRIEDFDAEDLDAVPPTINGGDFTFKILGQRGRFPL